MTLGERFASGAEAELEEVMFEYGEQLTRYATAILCDYQEAENTIQEVFISAYQNRKKFDGKNLSAWLRRITYNRCINFINKKKPLYMKEGLEVAAPVTPDDALSDETLKALEKLKPKERAIIYGRAMDGFSYDELAELTGRSPATLRKQYERAKKKLADALGRKEDGHE